MGGFYGDGGGSGGAILMSAPKIIIDGLLSAQGGAGGNFAVGGGGGGGGGRIEFDTPSFSAPNSLGVETGGGSGGIAIYPGFGNTDGTSGQQGDSTVVK